MSTNVKQFYILNSNWTKYVCLYLNRDLKPEVKIVSDLSAVVLNKDQWCALMVFKDYVKNYIVHELWDSSHTLDLYYGQVRITYNNVHVLLDESEWKHFKNVADLYINMYMVKVYRQPKDLIEWQGSGSLVTPPPSHIIEYDGDGCEC